MTNCRSMTSLLRSIRTSHFHIVFLRQLSKAKPIDCFFQIFGIVTDCCELLLFKVLDVRDAKCLVYSLLKLLTTQNNRLKIYFTVTLFIINYAEIITNY